MNDPALARDLPDRLWSPDEVADYLGKTPASLATMRWPGHRPVRREDRQAHQIPPRRRARMD